MTPPRSSDLAVLRRGLSYTKGMRFNICLIALLSALGTPLALLSPIPLKIVLDSVLGDEPLPGFVDEILPEAFASGSNRILLVAAVLQVLVVVLLQAQSMGMYVLQTHTEERINLSLRARLMNHVQRLSFAFHDARGTADTIYRVQYDAPALGRVAVFSLIPLISAVITLLAMAVVIFRIDGSLALVAVSVMPVLYLVGRSYKVRMRPRYALAKALESSALGAVQEILMALRVVKAFGREDHEAARFVDQADRSAREKVRLSAAEGLLAIATNLTTALGTGAVLYMGARGVQSGRLTIGELLVVVSYLGQLYGPVQTISRQSATLQGQLASMERAFDLLDEIPDVLDRPRAKALGRARGAISFHKVAASYDGGRTQVLRSVDLDLPAGSRIGIRGPTGAGKTTLVSLLTRFIDPVEGMITLDGTDLRDYTLADLRRQYSIMWQEPLLFSTSIGENIAYARPGATRDEIVAAARAAGAHDFIETLPEGYDTLVGERGLRLSGGERQRVSLARAFLRDAPILVLDEPTSSVDVATERAIMAAMQRLMENRTTLMIAHRLSTLEGCDLVLDVRDTTVTAAGTKRKRIAPS